MTIAASTLTLERYTKEARAWVAAAQHLADERAHVEVQPLHLLSMGLLPDVGVALVLQRAGVDAKDVHLAVEQALRRMPQGEGTAFLSTAFLGLLRRAEREAETIPGRRVRPEDLLAALNQSVRGDVAEILAGFKLGPGGLKAYIDVLRQAGSEVASPLEDKPLECVRDWVDTTWYGLEEPVIGRSEDIRRVLTVLERRDKCSALLVGEAGVGKSAVLRGVAQRMAAGDVAANLSQARLLEIDLGILMSTSRLRGEAENRLRRLLETHARGGLAEAVFIVRSPAELTLSGPLSPDFASVFRFALSQKQIRVLITMTPVQFRKLQVQQASLVEFLTPVPIEPASVALSLDVLRGVAYRLEQHHALQISEFALEASVRFAARYLSERFLPESALDLLDQAAALRRVALDGVTPEFDGDVALLATLRVQRAALQEGEPSEELIKELDARIAAVHASVEERRRMVSQRRGTMTALRHVRQELEHARSSLRLAKEKRDFARVGELEHATLPSLMSRKVEAEHAAQAAGADLQASQLDESHVARAVSDWTGIPLDRMLANESERMQQMEHTLSARVVGQPEAASAVTRAVTRSRVGLRDPKKPIGSFLFLGGSGVGKTEMAKALAEFLFDDEHSLTRLDMSEFMERHMVARLVGAPPGYADSDQGGFLTEAVRRRPYSVLLFDEVEKAHQDVFNLLLQVLDDGRLTDARGQLADFTNTVIIMTSNIGSDVIVASDPQQFETESGRAQIRQALSSQLAGFFRPELLNRVGDTVVFRPLGKPELRAVAALQLKRTESLLSAHGLTLVIEPDALVQLVELGHEPALGARPMARVIVREIQDPIASRIATSGIPSGSVIRVAYRDAAFTFDW